MVSTQTLADHPALHPRVKAILQKHLTWGRGNVGRYNYNLVPLNKLNKTNKDDKLQSNLLLQCCSGHVWKNLHGDTTGWRRILNYNRQTVKQKASVMMLVSTISQTFINCFLKSKSTPDIIIFIISGRGLNLECDLLSCKRGSKDWSRLHITCFYSTGEFYTHFLYRWIHTSTHTHIHRWKYTPSVCRGWCQISKI